MIQVLRGTLFICDAIFEPDVKKEEMFAALGVEKTGLVFPWEQLKCVMHACSLAVKTRDFIGKKCAAVKDYWHRFPNVFMHFWWTVHLFLCIYLDQEVKNAPSSLMWILKDIAHLFIFPKCKYFRNTSGRHDPLLCLLLLITVRRRLRSLRGF